MQLVGSQTLSNIFQIIDAMKQNLPLLENNQEQDGVSWLLSFWLKHILKSRHESEGVDSFSRTADVQLHITALD